MKFFHGPYILGLALILGVMTTALCTLLFLSLVLNPRSIQNDIIVRGGTSVWLVSGSDATGLSWRTAEQTTNLQVPSLDLDANKGQWSDGVSDGWCELLPAPTRSGALAVGWPFPWIIWRFSNEKIGEWFPRPLDNTDQVVEIAAATKRIFDGGHITMNSATSLVAVAVILTLSTLWLILIRVVIASRKKSNSSAISE